MRGLNRVIIMGNLWNSPDSRFLPNGNAVTTISVATSEGWKDKSGEKREHTEWHRIVLFNRLAEVAAQFLKKGSRVFVEGYLRTNKWKDQSGNDRYTTEIIANNMQILDYKDSSDNPINNEHNFAKDMPKAPTMETSKQEHDLDDIPF